MRILLCGNSYYDFDERYPNLHWIFLNACVQRRNTSWQKTFPELVSMLT